MWLQAVNRLWQASYPMGTRIRLERDDLIRRARRITGLHDLGPDFWTEPLDRMLDSINEEARLNPVGTFITRERLVNLISIRLRATYYFNHFPEILQQELYLAWIIVGLQRTGTTKLHRLLAEDPDHRVIPSWEVINPVPFDLSIKPYEGGSGDIKPADKKRISVARTSVNAVRYLSPGFFAVHPLDAMLPEEDVLLLAISFMSTTTEAMMNVPSYTSWLETIDQTPAYLYYVKLLKLLQWFRPAKRWVLKSPHHLEFPDIITKCMPEVLFIWPHRRIYESIPSFLSMLTYNHMIFSDHVDPQEIARRWIRKTGYVLDKAMDYRSRPGHSDHFLDIRYRNLVSNAIGELDQLYRLDGGLTPELIRRFRDHEMRNPYRKHGKHSYSASDFGITERTIDEYTMNYKSFLKQYDIIQTAEVQ